MSINKHGEVHAFCQDCPSYKVSPDAKFPVIPFTLLTMFSLTRLVVLLYSVTLAVLASPDQCPAVTDIVTVTADTATTTISAGTSAIATVQATVSHGLGCGSTFWAVL